MTEPQWLKADDGDAMLAAVRDRLSPRKWALLACGVARRLWELLPDGPYREAIRFREDQANGVVPAADFSPWVQRLDEALPAARDRAEARQREVLAGCDPDAEGDEFEETVARRINPSVPLFRAASRQAWQAIEAARDAVGSAVTAIRFLFTETEPPRLAQIRRATINALGMNAASGSEAALALECKLKGDELADLGQVRNPRIRQAEAEEAVRRLADNATRRFGSTDERRAVTDNKALGKLLQEQLGNPFRPYRFEPRWRTEHVVGLARAIDEDRAYERYPILLDALLDADCEEEAVLRHVRGTEHHNPNCQHSIGCWVIDLILQKDEPLFALPPLKSDKAAPTRDPIAEPPFRDLDDDEDVYDGDME